MTFTPRPWPVTDQTDGTEERAQGSQGGPGTELSADVRERPHTRLLCPRLLPDACPVPDTRLALGGQGWVPQDVR